MKTLIARQLINVANILLLIAFVPRLVFAGSLPDGLKHSGPAPMLYGCVLESQLSDFAPDSASKGLHLLLSKDFSNAVVELQQQLTSHPGSHAIYAGLAQASPELVDKEVASLNNIPVQSLSELDKFKLATSLYYYWGMDPYGARAGMAQKAQRLLYSLWDKAKTPVVGLMLAETLYSCASQSDPSVKTLHLMGIINQLVRTLCGSLVYSDFAQAENQGWRASPPSDATIPIANRQAMLGVVTSLRSLYSSRSGTAKLVNGTYVPEFNPYTPEQRVAQQYFATWYNQLLNNVQSFHKISPK